MNFKYCRWYLIVLLYIINTGAPGQNPVLDSLVANIKKASGPSGVFTAQKNLAQYYSYTGNIEEYGSTCQQLLKSAQKAGNDTFLLIAYGHLANYFSNKSEFQSTLEYNLKALALAEKLNNIEKQCRFYNNIADVYRSLKNYSKSLEYLQKAQILLPKASVATPVLPRYVYINFCETYLGLNNTDSALRYVQFANEEFFRNKNDQEYVIVLYDFALIYEKKGDNDLAETYYKKSVALADSVKELYNLADATKYYCLFLLKQRKYAEVIRYAMKSIDAAYKSGNKLGVINAASLLHQSYMNLGKEDSAYKYLALKDAYRDTVFNEERINRIQEITFKEEIREKEREAELFKQKKTQQQNLEIVGIAIGILILLILFLALSRTVVVNGTVIKFLGLVLLLIFFEFISLIIHPWLATITHSSAVLVLITNVIIAFLLITPHHYFEQLINSKIVEKNKSIRLKAAKRLIESSKEKEKKGDHHRHGD